MLFLACSFSSAVASDSEGFKVLFSFSASSESVSLLSSFVSLRSLEPLSFAVSVGLTVLLSFAVLLVQAVMDRADNTAISSVCFKSFFFIFFPLRLVLLYISFFFYFLCIINRKRERASYKTLQNRVNLKYNSIEKQFYRFFSAVNSTVKFYD